MKKITLIFLHFFVFCFYAHAQQKKTLKYFDTDNKEITEKAFKKLRYTNTVLSIVGDSTNHHKLIKRDESGQVTNRMYLIATLEKATNTKIDTTKTIIIIYYPGKDPCNSGGTVNLTDRYKEAEKNADQISKSTTFYIYKDFKGLESYGNSINWVKDPENLIERLFFKYPYPCGSFTVINKTGAYISYFGEYPTYYILNAVKLLNNK